MGAHRRRATTWRVLAGATTAALLLGGCGAKEAEPQAAELPAAPPSSTPVAEEQPVEIVGAADPEAFSVGEPRSAPEPGGGLYPVSEVYPVRHDGPLGSPALVRVQLDNAVPRGTPVFVISRGTAEQPWSYLEGDLDPGRRHVEFIASEVGEVGVLAMDRRAVLAAVRDDLAGVPALPAPEATSTSCVGADAAREDGYGARSWKRSTLAWCFGDLGEGRTLRVTNTRSVPVRVSVPGTEAPETTGSSPEGTPWDAWSAAVDAGSGAWLAPGRSASYDVELDPGSALLATARDDARGRSVQALRSLSTTLSARLRAFGVEGAPTARKLFADLLAERACTRAFGKDAAALVGSCAGEDALGTLVPAAGVLLAPVLDAPVLRSTLAAELDRLAQEAAGVEQRIEVSRDEPTFEGLVGTYRGPRRSLVVSEAGLVTERLAGPKGPVIDLTYQLADATGTAARRGATATLTAVEVTDPKMISGAVPKVGMTGRFALEKGVVSPPFLGTTYCTTEAAKRCAG
ncbi:hypothetical protein [Nocardioides aurantiacus]|uniref:Lipoprotein n=1 Tax=Nocardioides aurantiacus TaxID=86796 RepID=A0A3N2CVQ1_9ACTN|nr:hypothetical protein [Nocardioides aurantiacus]ROR91569.1 hypothetical protein EDD33_2439 [Nocardioides aurantiacus]